MKLQAILLLLACVGFVNCVRTVNLTQLAIQQQQFICCETYAPTQQLFYCVWGNDPNFKTFDSNGVLQQFVPGAKGFGVWEQRVASVQNSPFTPFPLGGWHLGDIFIGGANGAVVKIVDAKDIINPWTVIPGQSETPQQTVFDRTGSVYDGDLIVSFAKSVWRVNSTGFPTLIYRSDSLLNYEGLEVVPVDDVRYGPLSGTILIPQNRSPYGGFDPNTPSSFVSAISRDGQKADYYAGCYVDQIWFVHEYDNFYGIDYSGGKVVAAPWDNIKAAQLDGEIIVQCESPEVNTIRRLFYNTVTKKVEHEAINYAAGSAVPVYLEHGCFSRGGSADILPGGFSFCYYHSDVDFDVMSDTITSFSSVKSKVNVLQNYGITGTPSSFSFPATGVPGITPGSITISILQDVQNGFYLQIVNQAATGTTGPYSLDLGLTYTGPSDPNMLVRIQNNPTDKYIWSGGNGRFTWTWSSGTTGVVIGPIAAIPGLQLFSFEFQVFSSSGLNQALIVSGDGQSFSQSITPGVTFNLNRISCKCGNGIEKDDIMLEHCEWNMTNHTCCQRDCQYVSPSYLCQSPDSGDVCSAPSYCTGKTPTCPPMEIIPACDCEFPRYGFNCVNVRCDLLENCGTCNNYTECGWCCGSGSSATTDVTSGKCTQAASCPTPYPRTCKPCPSSCGLGKCQCGVCECPAGYSGESCENIIDCFGVAIPPGQPVATIDICNVCGGNGTSCLGCDGIPYGKVYDVCGDCGGDGSRCYDPCGGYTNCGDCNRNDVCGWCASAKRCFFSPKEDECAGGFKKSCNDPVPVIVGASIGAGAIAGIVIGAAVFAAVVGFGGKKGYDYYLQRQANMNTANANPLYSDNGRTGANPFYDNSVEMSKA